MRPWVVLNALAHREILPDREGSRSGKRKTGNLLGGTLAWERNACDGKKVFDKVRAGRLEAPSVVGM